MIVITTIKKILNYLLLVLKILSITFVIVLTIDFFIGDRILNLIDPYL